MENILLFLIIFIVALVLSGKYLNKYSLSKYNYEPIIFSNIAWMVVPYLFLIVGAISENNSSINMGYLLSIFSVLIIGYNINKKSSMLIAIGSSIILFFSSIILVAVISSLFSSNDDNN